MTGWDALKARTSGSKNEDGWNTLKKRTSEVTDWSSLDKNEKKAAAEKEKTRTSSMPTQETEEQKRYQQFQIDVANAIDQASSKYIGDDWRKQQDVRNRDLTYQDTFSNRQNRQTPTYTPDYMDLAVTKLKSKLATEEVKPYTNFQSEQLSRNDRDALLNKYSEATKALNEPGDWNTRSKAYLDAIYEAGTHGGVEKLLAEQQADAENDREYGRQLRGVDISGMTTGERIAGTLGGIAQGAGAQIAAGGLGLVASGLNSAAAQAMEEYGPALEQAAKMLYWGLYDDPTGDFSEQEKAVRTAAAYIGGDAYADKMINRVRDYANQARQNGTEIYLSNTLFDNLDKEDVLWENLQGTIKGSGVYEGINKMQEASQKNIQYAKDVNVIQSKFGDSLVEAGVSTLQNTADAAMAALLGLSGGAAMIPFALRAYGGSYSEALQQSGQLGETIGRDVAKKAQKYGLETAAVEVGTEMMWGMVGAMSKVTNGGALDDYTLNKITEALSGMAKTEQGQKALAWIGEKVIGGVTEGLEEVVGDYANWILNTAGIMNGAPRQDFDEVFRESIHSFVTGALGGIMGEATNIVAQPMQRSQIGKQLKAGNLTTDNGQKITPEEILNIANLPGMENTTLAKTVTDLYGGLMRNSDSFSNEELGRLYEAYEATMGRSDTAISRIADAMDKVEDGQRLSNGEVNRITQNPDAVRYLQQNAGMADLDYSGPITNRRDAVETALKALASQNTGLYDAMMQNAAENTEEAQNARNDALQAIMNRQALPGEIADQYMADVFDQSARDALKERGVSDEAQAAIASTLTPGQDLNVAADEAANIYKQARTGSEMSDEILENDKISPMTASVAWDAARAEYTKELTNGGTEEELRLRTGLQGTDGESTGGQVQGVEQAPGSVELREGTAGFERSRPLSGVYSQPVSAAELGIIGGSTNKNIRILTNSTNPHVLMAQKIIEAQGLKFVAFTGGAMEINGEQVRGYYDPTTNTVYVRADHRLFNADQIARHEAMHDKIRKSGNPKELLRNMRDEMIRRLGGAENFEKVMRNYMALYERTGLDYERVFEEAVCDAAGNMNEFVYSGHWNDARAAKGFYEAAREVGRQPIETGEAAQTEGRASNDFLPQTEAEEKSMYDPNAAENMYGIYPDGQKFSLDSLKYDIVEQKFQRDLKTVLKWDDNRVKQLVNSLEHLIEIMEPERDILDVDPGYNRDNRPYSPYKPNSDPLYKISLDYSTLCRKRLMTQYIIEKLQLQLHRPMTGEEQIAIRDMLKEYREQEQGLQVACAMCYVEAARLKSPDQMNRYFADPEPILKNYFAQKSNAYKRRVEELQKQWKIDHGYNANATKAQMKKDKRGHGAADVDALEKYSNQIRIAYDPANRKDQPDAERGKAEQAAIAKVKTLSVDEYLSAKNLQKLKSNVETSLIYDAYTSYIRAATHSKGLETDVPYFYGDSKRKGGPSKKFIEAVNRENGMRFSSWSDFQFTHLLDQIMATIDLAVRGAAMHGYTKFPEQVRIFGNTGAMFNMSGVSGGTGFNEDGSLYFSPTESIDVNEAIKLRDQFPDTAGLQCIGINEKHTRALLASAIIDYVIPYHVSGLNATLRKMAGISNWKDYTSVQEERVINQDEKWDPSKNCKEKEWHKAPVFSEFFDKNWYKEYAGTGKGVEVMRMAADRYAKMCADRGMRPKFEEYLTGEGSENYWKLLIDRKMVNQKTGDLIQQRPVTPDFDFSVIEKEVGDYVKGVRDSVKEGKTVEDRAYDYIIDSLDQLPARIETLKREGAVEKNIAKAEKYKAKMKEAERQANILGNEMYAAHPKLGAAYRASQDLDSEGRQLSAAQQRFFKDSNVRDKNGNLLVMYHGSLDDFTVFDKNKIRPVDYDTVFNGFWFSSSESGASPAFRDAKYTKAVYLNITNPAPRKVWTKVNRDVIADQNVRNGARSYNDEVRYRLQDMGYDGVHYDGPYLFDERNVKEYNETGSTTFASAGGVLYDLRKSEYDDARLYPHGSWNEIIPYMSAEDFLEDNYNEYRREDIWVAFEPDQIKLVDNQNPTENPDIRYSRELAPVFYSKLEREIEAFKGDKIGAASAVQYLKGKGVKDEDIKWSGITTFLEGKKSVSKSDLIGFLRANRLEVVEEVLDDSPTDIYIGANGETINASHYFTDDGEEFESPDEFEKVAKQLAYDEGYDAEDVEVIDYGNMISAEVDGETILEASMPSPYDLADADAKSVTATRWEDYALDGGNNYREILYRLPQSNFQNDAMQVHWGRKGVVAHARVQDFISGGKKVLFVDEIQSDWHNEGAKSGYTGEDDSSKKERIRKERKAANDAYEDALKNATAAMQKYVFKPAGYDFSDFEATERTRDDLRYFSYATKEEATEWLDGIYGKWGVQRGAITKAVDALYEAHKKATERIDVLTRTNKEIHQHPVEDAPFRNNYTDFVLKDLLRKAAEGNYSYLAWTPGWMQEERWSKEYAEGYKIEYDQQIPAFLKKYGKQWGANVSRISLDHHYGFQVPAIEITDSMRDGVLYEGQPMFSRDLSTSDLFEANRQLRKDLSEMRQLLKTRTAQKEYWKGQTKVTEGRRLRQDDVNRLARELIKSGDSFAKAETIGKKLKDLGEYLLNTEDDFDTLHDQSRMMAYEIAHDILDNSKVLNTKGSEDFYQDFRDYLRNNAIYVAPSVRSELAPDGWNDFRKDLFGTMTLTADQTKGQTVDKAYQDLRSQFGDWLLPEDISNEADQLNRILEIVETYRPVYENQNSYDMADAVEWTTNEILTRIIGEEIRETNPTYADRMEKKLARQKEKSQAAIKRVRQQRDRKVENIKQHYRETAEKNRNRKIESAERERLLHIARRLSNMKLPRVQRALLDQYIGDLDLVSKSITGRTVRDLRALAARYMALKKKMGDDFIADPYIEGKLERLGKKQISDLTQEEVLDLTMVLQNIETMLRTEQKLINSKVKEDTYLAGERVIDDIRNSNGKTGFLNKFISTETATPEREIHRVTGYNEEDPLYQVTKELSDGQRKMLDYQMRAEALFKKWTTDKTFIRKIAGKNAELIKIQGLVDGNLKEAKITPAMRMSLYLHEKNDDNMTHIATGGVRIPDWDLYRKGKLQDAYDKGERVVLSRSMVKEIVSHMTPQEKAFADAASAYFNGMSRNEINDVSEETKGYALANVPFYFPINTDDAFLNKEFDTIKNDGSIEGMGFTKERKPSASNPVRLYDLTDVLNRSIQQHSKYVGLAIPVRNMNKLYRVMSQGYGTSVVEALKQNWGSEATKYIEKMMADIQNGTAHGSDVWGSALSKARSRYAAAVLTMNASVAMKQAASYPTAAAVVGWGPLIKAFADLRKYGDNTVAVDQLAKYTPLYWYRSKGFSTMELGDIGKGDKHIPKLLNWIQGIDMLTTRKLAKAAMYYVDENNKNLKHGSEEWYQEVARIYNRIIEETQPNYTMMQRPQILRSDSDFTRALNMFKTQPFQNFNILYDAFGNLAAKSRQYKASGTKENLEALQDARKNAAKAVGSQIVSAFVFALMQFVWDSFRGKTDKYRDEDGEKDVLAWMKGIGLNVLGSAGGMVPFGSYVLELGEAMTDAVLKAFKKDPFFDQTFYGLSENAAEAFNDVGNALIKTAKNAATALESGEISESTVRSVIESATDLAQFAGKPVGNILNLAKAIARKAILTTEDDKYIAEYKAMRLITDPKKYKSDYYKLLNKAVREAPDSYKKLYDMMLEDKDVINGDETFGTDAKSPKENIDSKIKDWGYDVLDDVWHNDPSSFAKTRTQMINLYGDPFATSTKTAAENIDTKVKGWEKEKAKTEAFYQNTLDDLQSSSLWNKATDKQKEKTMDQLVSIAAGQDEKMQSVISGGKSVGLDSTEYLLFKLALQMADAASDGNGSYTNAEYEKAIQMVPGLSNAEKSYLWSSSHSSDKNNPWR